MEDINLRIRGSGGQQTAAEVDMATRALRRYAVAAEAAAAAGGKLASMPAPPSGGFGVGGVAAGAGYGGIPATGVMAGGLASASSRQLQEQAELEANRQLNQRLSFQRTRTQQESLQQSQIQAQAENARREAAARAADDANRQLNARQHMARVRTQEEQLQQLELRANAENARRIEEAAAIAKANAARDLSIRRSKGALNDPDLHSNLAAQTAAGYTPSGAARNLGLLGDDARTATAQYRVFNAAQKQAALDSTAAANAFRASGTSLQDLQAHIRTTGASLQQTTQHFQLTGSAATGAAMALRQAAAEEAARDAQISQLRQTSQHQMQMGGIMMGAGALTLAPLAYGVGQYGKAQLTDLGAGAEFGADAPGVTKQARADSKTAFGLNYRDILDAERMFHQAGETIAGARDATLSLSDAIAGVGKDPETLQRMLINLGQIRAQAKLSAVDLKQLDIAGLGGTMRIARGLGISQGELREKMKSGDISGESAFRAIISEWKKDFGGRGKTITETTLPGQMDELKDNFQELSEISGKVVVPSLLGLAKAGNSSINWLQQHPDVVKAGSYAAMGIGVPLLLGGAGAFIKGQAGHIGSMMPSLTESKIGNAIFGGGIMQRAGTSLLTASVNLNAAASKLALSGGVPGAGGGVASAAGMGIGGAAEAAAVPAIGMGFARGALQPVGTLGVAGAGVLGAIGGYQQNADMKRVGYDAATSAASGAFVGVGEAAAAMFVPGGAVAVAFVEGARFLFNQVQDAKDREAEAGDAGSQAADAAGKMEPGWTHAEKASNLHDRWMDAKQRADDYKVSMNPFSWAAQGLGLGEDQVAKKQALKAEAESYHLQWRRERKKTHGDGANQVVFHQAEADMEAQVQAMRSNTTYTGPTTVTNAPRSAAPAVNTTPRATDEGSYHTIFVPHDPVVRDLRQALRAHRRQ